MPKIEIDTLSLDGLKQLQKDIAQAIEGYEARKRQEALAAVQAKAEEMGFSLQELVGSTKLGTTKSAPKYRNPDDATKTWTGRGRQPQWVKDHLAAGGMLNELLIVK